MMESSSALGSLAHWQALAEPSNAALVDEAMRAPPRDVAAVARLRKHWSAELVHVALLLAEARRKAVLKFGARAATLWADPQGVEMASSVLAADHKCARFSLQLQDWPMLDLCSGIGGDAMSLARCFDLTVVDRDPVRAWMAAKNARCSLLVRDAESCDSSPGPLHIDPARRDAGGRRAWSLDAMQPDIEVVLGLLARTSWGGAVKLSPGADLDAVQSRLGVCEVEVISENGRLTQAVAWTGDMWAHGTRTATLIRGSPDEPWEKRRTHALTGAPLVAESPPAIADALPCRYLYEPDDSVERADLLHVLCATVGAPMLHPRVGLLTADAIIDSPWLTPFEMLAHTPWNQKRVAAMLRDRRAGIVEVKTRGGVVNPDELQPALSGDEGEPLVLFVLRMGEKGGIHAIIAKRLSSTASDQHTQ
jgi:hypothetical protein